MAYPTEHRIQRVATLDPMAKLADYNLSDVRALVVDHNPLMRKTIAGILSIMGVKDLHVAHSEREALTYQADHPADLVFTDWAPQLNGVGIVKSMRAGHGQTDPFVPIIMMTANTEERHVVEARDAGMTEYLAKPFSPMLIYKRICSVIEKPRPFIKCGSFFGPDRRRRVMQLIGNDRRKSRGRKKGYQGSNQPSTRALHDLRRALEEEAKNLAP